MDQRFQQIEDIYQSINIYRSLIVYHDKEDFLPLKELLVLNDYPISDGQGNRMYTMRHHDLGNRDANIDIQWDTINVVICLDDVSFECVKETMDTFPNLILLIKI
jgi:hypothetical protein